MDSDLLRAEVPLMNYKFCCNCSFAKCCDLYNICGDCERWNVGPAWKKGQDDYNNKLLNIYEGMIKALEVPCNREIINMDSDFLLYNTTLYKMAGLS